MRDRPNRGNMRAQISRTRRLASLGLREGGWCTARSTCHLSLRQSQPWGRSEPTKVGAAPCGYRLWHTAIQSETSAVSKTDVTARSERVACSHPPTLDNLRPLHPDTVNRTHDGHGDGLPLPHPRSRPRTFPDYGRSVGQNWITKTCQSRSSPPSPRCCPTRPPRPAPRRRSRRSKPSWIATITSATP